MFREDNFLDMRPPKSPRRFLAAAFSPLKSATTPPMPPLPTMPLPPTPVGVAPYTPPKSSGRGANRKSHTPSSSTSSFGHGLGFGAEVVRTPSEALKGVRQPVTPGTGRSDSEYGSTAPNDSWIPPTGPTRPLRHQRSDIKSRPSVSSRPSAASGVSEYSVASTETHTAVTVNTKVAAPGDKYRKHQSISPGTRTDRQVEHRLAPKVSAGSLNTSPLPSVPPSTPSPSPHVHNLNKKFGHTSMSPSPRLQTSLGNMSTFDPFGLGSTHSAGEVEHVDAKARSDVQRQKDRTTFSPSKPSTAKEERRATIKPPSRPVTLLPFHAILKAKTTKPAPTSRSEVLITLEFGYSLDETPKNTSVTLPWSVLAKAGGHLVRFVKENLTDEEDELERGVSMPDMTDGSSAEDSDRESGSYDLDGLLRDEYLKSLWISSPAQLDFPPPPPLPPIPAKRSSINPKTGKKRAATRNQYIQSTQYPSPGSPFAQPASLAVRRQAPEPKVAVEETDGGGSITELTVLITRDAAVYHIIAARLAMGEWVKIESNKKKRVEEECRWLGMSGLAGEMAELLGKSMVLRGGSGYI